MLPFFQTLSLAYFVTSLSMALAAALTTGLREFSFATAKLAARLLNPDFLLLIRSFASSSSFDDLLCKSNLGSGTKVTGFILGVNGYIRGSVVNFHGRTVISGASVGGGLFFTFSRTFSNMALVR